MTDFARFQNTERGGEFRCVFSDGHIQAIEVETRFGPPAQVNMRAAPYQMKPEDAEMYALLLAEAASWGRDRFAPKTKGPSVWDQLREKVGVFAGVGAANPDEGKQK